jgi:glycosyltransferase involved in cell wall biosynthesis
VVPSLISGGVERGTIDIALKLKESYNPIVISVGGPLVTILIHNQIPHIYLNVASKNPFLIWNNAKFITKIVKEYNVDIIHARSRAPAWSCYMVAQATGKKFITTFHGIYNISNMMKKYYNSIMTKGERVIAVSNFVKQHILDNYNIEENRIEVIHRGVDYQYFNPDLLTAQQILLHKEKYNIPKNVPVILLPARMTEWKGHAVLIEALNIIKHLDFYCLIVGDLSKHPNFAARICNRIDELKLQNKVQMFGDENYMFSLYGVSDLVLSTSIVPEAFGRIIIEAQSMRKLVIATNLGGAAETILDEHSGYHVKPNDVNELADKISYCLSILGSAKAEEITANARQSVINNFSLELMLNKTLNIYEEVTK